MVILAKESVGTSGARFAVSQGVELDSLAAAIGGARGNDTITINTCQTIAASVIARAAMIEVGFGIAGDTAAVGVSEASAAYTVKTVGTGIAACAAVVDVGLGIGAGAVAARVSIRTCACAIDASAMRTAVRIVITAMRCGIGFACRVGAIVVKMGIANTGCDLALPRFCTNTVAPVRNGGTVHASAMLGIVGDAGIAILIESGHACTSPCNASPMRSSIARTRIGDAVIGFFNGIADPWEFANTADQYIAVFAGACTGCPDEVFIIVACT